MSEIIIDDGLEPREVNYSNKVGWLTHLLYNISWVNGLSGY